MTAGTSNGLAMIRRAIPRPRSSILLEVAKETLHPSALCRACTVGQIRARNRPAVGSGELFIWALPKRRIDFPAPCQVGSVTARPSTAQSPAAWPRREGVPSRHPDCRPDVAPGWCRESRR